MAASSSPSGGKPRPRGAPVGQEELRRLMRAKQREAAAAGKKKTKIIFEFISLTFNATYNSLGNLSCSLCNVSVKSELLWQTHTLGKQHKEKLEQLKALKQSTPGPIPNTSSSLKRKSTNTESPEQKKTKEPSDHPQVVPSGLPKDFFSKTEQAEVESPKPSACGLLLGDYGEEEENADETPEEINYLDNKALAAPLVSHSGSIQKAETQEKIMERRENTAEALPEGFFDDPEVDAKVRKVDAPKDQMDKEWDEFQKAIRQVNTISEAIVAEEDEEGRLDRQIGEIDEQIECFRRVEQLRDRQEIMKDKLKEVMRLRAAQAKEEDDIGSDDEGELQDLLSQDWRAKGTLL
ncbi:hypothetical protein JD844_002495 [Phrynosoma platyrhinos]|uniref:Zinc finger protein 830 n=1 Tax=Phrynosoma platyrhinos TaxID=52577 RepID=A0ABQ7TCD5_PHRPL|nr:hypothetical protein JD844_002495 [Phrynosoma platyrhinos]